MKFRHFLDKAFTGTAYFGCTVVALSLLIVLVPIVWKGGSAVIFQGTIEFRELQQALHRRGDPEKLAAESAEASEARQPAYAILDEFERGIRTDLLTDRAKTIHRQFTTDLQNTDFSDDEQLVLRRVSRTVRNALLEAYGSTDKAHVLDQLRTVLEYERDHRFEGTVATGYFRLAREYQRIAETVDLSQREEYEAAVAEVREILHLLLGPNPNAPLPALIMEQYGTTRMDAAHKALDRLLWTEQWVAVEPGMPLVKERVPRVEQFKGTQLAPLFTHVQNNLDDMLRPRLTIYWQYFFDDSVSSHFFGGVGPEILGTLLITVLTILFAVPLGVVSAAYLVECAGDNVVVSIIRVCINTLAGVPSIVFGLFGLAFFVLFLLPLFGFQEGSSILAGALTLSVLVLPIVIRASEEAIRSVPQTYKEAALSLGSGRFRAFVTVTLPAALPGILTGVILSMSRAAGETAPILFTAAVAMGPVAKSLAQPTRALSYGSYDMAVGDRIAAMVPHNQFGMVMTLIMVVLLLNLAAIVVRARTAKKLRGG